ncbi:COG4223 family protein [Pseudopelagicola sp. nBUS_19]|uniref:COG4223 family protein n=1 Tax=Pseudopelagicola sp. nBUS_19 TaxID=3395316 RepID=UPI003EBC83AB
MGNSDEHKKPEENQIDQEIQSSVGLEDAKNTRDLDELPVKEFDAVRVEGDVPSGVKDPKPIDKLQQETPEITQRSKLVPLVIGGVFSGVLGFGAAVFVGNWLGFSVNSEVEMAELHSELDVQEQLIKTLQSDLVKIAETANKARQTAQELANQYAESANFGARFQVLEEKVSIFEARLIDIEKRPLSEGLSSAAIAAYEQEVEDLKVLISAQKAKVTEQRQDTGASARMVMAQSAVTRIVTALASGAPYRKAIVDFDAATGRSVPAVIEEYADRGVVTVSALIDAFPEQARAALAKARVDKVDNTDDSKLGSFLKTYLAARSVEPKVGLDTDAVLSRAEASLREGRLEDALTELDALAEGPQAVLSEWRALAETRLTVIQATGELAQNLNTN